MSRAFRFFGTVLFSVFLVMACYGRSSARAHAVDFIEVFNGYDDPILRRIYEKFSFDVDDNKNAEVSTSVSARIKRRIAEKNGLSIKEVHLTAHRYIAHRWPYRGSIPFSDLAILEKKYPGCTEDIREIWGSFCRENNDRIAREFGWQQAKHLAQAYCEVLYYTHLLADRLPPPENTKYDFVMEVEKIVERLQEAVKRMGSSTEHQLYCKAFNSQMSAALSAGRDSKEKAKFALEALKSMKLGTMLHEHYGIHGQMDEVRHPYHVEETKQDSKDAA